jgi:TonB-dependent starch-binding outer membrane protein SusC
MALRYRVASFCAALLFVLLAAPVTAQTAYTIQGSVVDETTAAPIAGVQIQVRGTGFGTLSDANGRFMLRADLTPGTYDVVFSYIGRRAVTRSVTLGTDATVALGEVRLAESALELDEIIVTGTGAATARRAIGNAVSTVTPRQLEEAPAITIDQALQGKVSGALITANTGTPGGGMSIRLRGTSSITGGAEPLFIVDGVIIDNNADQQINVGYRSNPINRLADLDPSDIERVEIIKGAAAAALYGSRANNGVVQIFTRRGRAGETRITATTRATRSDLERRVDFAMTPYNFTLAAGAVTDRFPAERFDPQGLIFRDAWGSDSHVSVSGGTADTRYYMSGGYTTQEGIMIGSAHNKLNARLNLDQNFGTRFSIAAGANYVQSNSDLVISGEQGEGGLLTAIMFTPTTVNLGEVNPETGDYVVQQTTFPNPLVVVRDWILPQNVNRFVGSAQARAIPMQDLTLEYRLGYDSYNMETRQSIPRESAWVPEGRTTSANRANMLINNDLVANLSWRAGDALGMTTSAGMNHTYQRVDQLNASARDITPLTRFVRGAIQSASQSRTELVTLGFFGQQQVAVLDRLFLTGALRVDGSSTFGSEERWQMYPKIAGSYVLSDEGFFQESALGDWLGQVRLRAALGYAGNQPPLGAAYARTPRFGTAINIDRLGLVPLAVGGNPELRPERQREVETGIDISTAGDRIGLSFTYYDQLTDDLLLSRVFAPSTGMSSMLDNVGSLSNRGIEAELNTVNVSRDNFRWSSTFIFSRNRNRVEQLEGDPFFVGYTNRVEEGHPLGVHYMPSYSRDAQGNIRFDTDGLPIIHRNADGVIERQIVGNPWPDYTASMRNSLDIGNSWTLAVLLDGQFGHEIWNQGRRIMDIFGAGPLFDEVLQACQIGQAECQAAQNRRVRLQSIWESYLEDASFVKLRELTARYTVPATVAQRVGAGGIQLELMGRNLFTWTDYTGYDPEINMFGLSTVERGTDFAVYPNAREISFGVRVNY